MANADLQELGRPERNEKPWTFITNHAAVLSLLAKQPRITARQISQEVGITERSVRLIISDLEKSGYIVKTREGRGARYLVDPTRSLRHRTHQDVAVGHLISILSAKDRATPKNPVP
ncbi:MAG: winged helix-turn-helix domain-containing protein [Deltaproteobacteria bacterium]|nr:winged helix-turn-helix domain-containing protein [Deltaproteobacteria bacterium]